MNRKKRTELEKNIIASLQAYRLNKEIEIIEAEISGGPLAEGEEKKKGVKAFFKSLISETKSGITKGRGEKDIESAKDNYAAFIADLPEDVSIEMSKDEESFSNLIHSYFDKDEGSAKISMALELIALEDDPEGPQYLREDQSRQLLSAFFLDDKDMLDNIAGFFSKAYGEIGSPKGNNFSRGFLYGLTAGSIAMLGPRLIAKVFGINTDAAPARKLVAESAKALAASELLMISTLVGGGYLSKRKYKRKASKKLRAIIRDSLDNEVAYSFATAITLWEFNHNGELEEAKEDLDLIIKMIDDVRSDAEYLALVEKTDQEANLKKVLVCNNAIAFLSSIRHL